MGAQYETLEWEHWKRIGGHEIAKLRTFEHPDGWLNDHWWLTKVISSDFVHLYSIYTFIQLPLLKNMTLFYFYFYPYKWQKQMFIVATKISS